MKSKTKGLEIEVAGQKEFRTHRARLSRLIKALYKEFFKNKSLNKSLRSQKGRVSGGADLSVTFLSSGQMKKVNSKFRGKNKPTDVLSFPEDQPGQGLGEIAVCLPILRRQAKEHGLTLQMELDYMVIHGFLHLLGYDHEKNRKEELKMMRLQDRLFSKFSRKLQKL